MRFFLTTILLFNLIFFLGCKTTTEDQSTVSSSLSQPVEEPKEEVEEEKPQTIIVPTGSLGDISETRIKILEKTLESKLDDFFAIVPKELFEKAQEKAFEELDYEECTEEQCIMMIQELLQVENAFQLVLISEEGNTQISLTWSDLDQRRVEEIYCEGCKTKELRESIEELVEKLVGVKEVVKEEPPKKVEPVVVETPIKTYVTNEPSTSKQSDVDSFEKYEYARRSSRETVGCGLTGLDCLKPLILPEYKNEFHLKQYRRVILEAKHIPWKQTELYLSEGDVVYIIGSGEAIICHECDLKIRKLTNPYGWTVIQSIIGDKMKKFKFKELGGVYETEFRSPSNGELLIVVRDFGDSQKPNPYSYSDNAGSFLLDIFTFDKNLRKGFSKFIKSVIKVNSNDVNIRGMSKN